MRLNITGFVQLLILVIIQNPNVVFSNTFLMQDIKTIPVIQWIQPWMSVSY